MTGDRLLARREVEERCGIGRRPIDRLMGSQDFPAPLPVGERASNALPQAPRINTLDILGVMGRIR